MIELTPILQIALIVVLFAIGFTLFMTSLIGFFWIPTLKHARYYAENKTLCPSVNHSTLTIGYSPVKVIQLKPTQAHVTQYEFLDRESNC